MTTLNQLIRNKRLKKKKRTKVPALNACPQKKGTCLQVFRMSPKKPNSAKRTVTRIRLTNKKKVVVFIPGINHNLIQHNSVLIRGGRVPDLPGIKYKVIRGKNDCQPVVNRIRGRSKYGVSKI